MCQRVPDHLEWGSAQLAENWAELHRMQWPDCGGVHAFPCGDHFHIGHVTGRVGRACKQGRHAEQHPAAPATSDTLQQSPVAPGQAAAQL